MDRSDAVEAQDWIAEELAPLRDLSYHDLLRVRSDGPMHRPMLTTQGTSLVLETQVVWDDSAEENVRVLVDVFDPAARFSSGVARGDFIRAPDGSFVGE